MKQFRPGDIVRRVGPTTSHVRKGWLYTVVKTHGVEGLILKGVDKDAVHDVSGFQLEPSLRPGIKVGGWVRRTGVGRNEVISGGCYQVEKINEFSLSLVGIEGTYSFGKFEPIPETIAS